MNKVKTIFCLVLFIISFIYMVTKLKNIEILNLVEPNQKKLTSFTLSKIDLKNPISILDLKKVQISKDKHMQRKPNKIKKQPKEPVIYIYNTHETERYKSNPANINITVKTLSNILKENLEKLNIPTYVEQKEITKEVKKRGLDYTGTYEVSFDYLKERKKLSPTIKYFIDIHRDSVTGPSSKVTINNKAYATLMFLIGQKNQNYKKNEKNIKIIENYLKRNYKGLVRSTYYQKHSSFNQSYNENMFLIEIGGPENTLEEVYNTAEALSKALKYYVEVKDEK